VHGKVTGPARAGPIVGFAAVTVLTMLIAGLAGENGGPRVSAQAAGAMGFLIAWLLTKLVRAFLWSTPDAQRQGETGAARRGAIR
jgi:hypothetical protein